MIPVAKSLIGKKSGLVAITEQGGVKEKTVKAGKIGFEDEQGTVTYVDVDEGAIRIMETLKGVKNLCDIHGDEGTYMDAMLKRMKEDLHQVSEDEVSHIKIKDLMAIDTFVPVNVKGALAGELAMEKRCHGSHGQDRPAADDAIGQCSLQRTRYPGGSCRSRSGHGVHRIPDDKRDTAAAGHTGFGWRFDRCSHYQ